MSKFWLMTVALLAVLNLGPQACSAPKGNSLSVEEAKAVLSPIIPNIKIIHVKPSAVDGLWEIGMEVNGRKAIIYLDHAKKHIISPVTQGELIDIESRASLTQEAFQEINKVDVSTIPLKDALVMGSEDAANKIIVFSDVD
jgi:thiol:disulfide interchange protein DsbC